MGPKDWHQVAPVTSPILNSEEAPIGIAAIFLTPLVLPNVRPAKSGRLDLTGVALSTLAMVLLMLPLVEGPERGWAGWPVAMLVASPVAFGGFY
jgi:hypothetical protein